MVGGGAMREPPPEFDPSDKAFDITASVMDSPTWRFVEKYLRLDVRSRNRVSSPCTSSCGSRTRRSRNSVSML